MKLVISKSCAERDIIRKVFQELPKEYRALKGTVRVYAKPDELKRTKYAGTTNTGFLVPSKREIHILTHEIAKQLPADAEYLPTLIAIFFHEVRHLWQIDNLKNWQELYDNYVSFEEDLEAYSNNFLETDANSFMVIQMGSYGYYM